MRVGPRNQAIDALRGVSILMVMLVHGAAPLPLPLQSVPLLMFAVQNGGYGVPIFFVISGFLISSNILKRYGRLADVQIDQFYAMRIARIFPCLALFLAVYFVLFKLKIAGFVPVPDTLFYDSVKSLAELRYGDFLVHGGNVDGLLAFAPLWSISVEETFYLLFPIVCFLLRADRVTVGIAVSLVVLGPSLRQNPTDVLQFWGCADLLAMGSLAAKATAFLSKMKLPTLALLSLNCLGIAIIVLCFLTLSNRTAYQWSWSALGIGTGLFLVGASLRPSGAEANVLVSRCLLPLSFLGSMSLQLYVFHVMFLIAFRSVLNLYVSFGLFLAFAFLLGKFFLDPVNELIRRAYRRSEITEPIIAR